jgi:hypothetical protein
LLQPDITGGHSGLDFSPSAVRWKSDHGIPNPPQGLCQDNRVTREGGARRLTGRWNFHTDVTVPAGCHPACGLGLPAVTLSYRGVEDLVAERGLDISYETVRSWVLKFGPVIARRLRGRRPRPSGRWHLDEMVVRIAGNRMYVWRAVDHEGEVLDMLVQSRRDSRAGLRLMRKLLRKQGLCRNCW